MNQNSVEIPNLDPKEASNDTGNVFGNILREAREASGKTKKQIATELGISEEECLELETGKKLPKASQLKKLTTAYCAMDGELESALEAFPRKYSSRKVRTVFSTDPISRSGRVEPHHGLGDAEVD